MDLNTYKSRLRKRRLKNIILGFVTFGVLVYTGISITNSAQIKLQSNSESISNLKTPFETKAGENWKHILAELDNLRVSAILLRDASLLDNVYASNSPLRDSDISLIENLIESQAEVAGLRFEIISLNLVSHRWSNDEEVVELSLYGNRSAYRLLVGEEVVQNVEEKSTYWLISLTKEGDNWLIGNAVPNLNNS